MYQLVVRTIDENFRFACVYLFFLHYERIPRGNFYKFIIMQITDFKLVSEIQKKN